MGTTVSVENRTECILNVTLKQVGPLYYKNKLRPGETIVWNPGKVWFTFEARLWCEEKDKDGTSKTNEYCTADVVMPIALTTVGAVGLAASAGAAGFALLASAPITAGISAFSAATAGATAATTGGGVATAAISAGGAAATGAAATTAVTAASGTVAAATAGTAAATASGTAVATAAGTVAATSAGTAAATTAATAAGTLSGATAGGTIGPGLVSAVGPVVVTGSTVAETAVGVSPFVAGLVGAGIGTDVVAGIAAAGGTFILTNIGNVFFPPAMEQVIKQWKENFIVREHGHYMKYNKTFIIKGGPKCTITTNDDQVIENQMGDTDFQLLVVN